MLLGLALIDLVATIIWVDTHRAVEANPIMDYFISQSTVLFAAIKLLFTFFGVLILHKLKTRRNKLVFNVSIGLVAIYSLLACWHVANALKSLV